MPASFLFDNYPPTPQVIRAAKVQHSHWNISALLWKGYHLVMTNIAMENRL